MTLKMTEIDTDIRNMHHAVVKTICNERGQLVEVQIMDIIHPEQEPVHISKRYTNYPDPLFCSIKGPLESYKDFLRTRMKNFGS